MTRRDDEARAGEVPWNGLWTRLILAATCLLTLFAYTGCNGAAGPEVPRVRPVGAGQDSAGDPRPTADPGGPSNLPGRLVPNPCELVTREDAVRVVGRPALGSTDIQEPPLVGQSGLRPCGYGFDHPPAVLAIFVWWVTESDWQTMYTRALSDGSKALPGIADGAYLTVGIGVTADARKGDVLVSIGLGIGRGEDEAYVAMVIELITIAMSRV